MNNFGEKSALKSQALIEAEFLQNKLKYDPKTRDRLLLGFLILYLFWSIYLIFSTFPLLIIIEVPSIICLLMAYKKSTILSKKAQKDLKFYVWISIFKSIICFIWTLYIFNYHMESKPPGDETPAQWHNSGDIVGITCIFEFLYFIAAIVFIIRMTSKVMKSLAEQELGLQLSSYTPL